MEPQLDSKTPAFELRSVTYSYPTSVVKNIDHLDLIVPYAKGIGLIGPSGEGKSTIIKLMTGLIAPDEGESFFLGKDLQKVSHVDRIQLMRRMGMTFQNSGLFDSLSCRENLVFPLEESGVRDSAEIEERVRQAFLEVGLHGIDNLRTHQISGGMRKRLGIARAHILKPKVVIYDEPTAGLDPITSRAITDLISKLRDEHHVTVVLITNDPTQAFQIAETVSFVGSGRVLMTGNAADYHGSEMTEVKRYFSAVHDMMKIRETV